MCALTIASSVSPDPRNDSSWTARAAPLRIEPEKVVHVVPLCFRDLHVDPDDLTTVGAALAHCSPEDLLAAVMKHEVGWRIPVDTVGSRAHHMLLRRVANALETMRSLQEAAVALSPSREGYVGPLFRFTADSHGSGLAYGVSAVVFSARDVEGISEVLEVGMRRVCTWDELRTLQRETPSTSAMKRLGLASIRESSALLARMSWERALSLPLWLPSDLSEDERYAILAKVFWSLTYRGFSLEETRTDALDEADGFGEGEHARICAVPWPVDSVETVLDHNCWIDTLEAWNALFGAMRSCETRP